LGLALGLCPLACSPLSLTPGPLSDPYNQVRTQPHGDNTSLLACQPSPPVQRMCDAGNELAASRSCFSSLSDPAWGASARLAAPSMRTHTLFRVHHRSRYDACNERSVRCPAVSASRLRPPPLSCCFAFSVCAACAPHPRRTAAELSFQRWHCGGGGDCMTTLLLLFSPSRLRLHPAACVIARLFAQWLMLPSVLCLSSCCLFCVSRRCGLSGVRNACAASNARGEKCAIAPNKRDPRTTFDEGVSGQRQRTAG
jgi:hypothetical protein